MTTAVNRLRAFFEPVTEAQSPRLAERLRVNAILGVEICLFMGAIVHVSEVLRGRCALLHSVILVAVTWAINLPLLITLKRQSRLRPGEAEWIAAAAAVVSMGDLVATGIVTSLTPTPMYLPYIAVIPFGYASIMDWRPPFPFGLGVIGALTTAVVGRAVYGLEWATMELWIVLCIALGLAGMATNQSRRRAWLELDRTDARNRLIAADRLAQLGRVSGTLAHEVKSPLATALNQLAVARSLSDELALSVGHEGVTPADLSEIVTELSAAIHASHHGVEQAAHIVQSMREHTRAGGPIARVRFSLRARIDGCVRLLQARLTSVGVAVKVTCGDESLNGPPLHFDRALTNLLSNAIDAIESAAVGSTITITVAFDPAGTRVTVSDDGPGVPLAIRDTLFEQGVTTKASDRGLGLGLWISRNLIESGFGGRLTLVDDQGPGARFQCWFPARGRPESSPVE